jgi:hypothetical protein
MNVAFVLGVAPLLLTLLLLIAGAITGVWLSGAIARALSGMQTEKNGDGERNRG